MPFGSGAASGLSRSNTFLSTVLTPKTLRPTMPRRIAALSGVCLRRSTRTPSRTAMPKPKSARIEITWAATSMLAVPSGGESGVKSSLIPSSMTGHAVLSAKQKEMSETGASHNVRQSTWSGLRAGDRVEIDDPRARRGVFEFVAFVQNSATKASWVEVVGGKRGDRKLWSFRPDQVFAPGDKGKGPSLEEAPRLPF